MFLLLLFFILQVVIVVFSSLWKESNKITYTYCYYYDIIKSLWEKYGLFEYKIQIYVNMFAYMLTELIRILLIVMNIVIINDCSWKKIIFQ